MVRRDPARPHLQPVQLGRHHPRQRPHERHLQLFWHGEPKALPYVIISGHGLFIAEEQQLNCILRFAALLRFIYVLVMTFTCTGFPLNPREALPLTARSGSRDLRLNPREALPLTARSGSRDLRPLQFSPPVYTCLHIWSRREFSIPSARRLSSDFQVCQLVLLLYTLVCIYVYM